MAALIDGFDVAMLNSNIELTHRDGRRLAARLRERRGLLFVVGGDLAGAGTVIRLRVTPIRWVGIGKGYGHLQGRRVVIEATGRGNASRPRRTELWLPAPDGPYAESITSDEDDERASQHIAAHDEIA